MCGRFAITLPRDAVASYFDADPGELIEEPPRLNVSPTEQITVVVAGTEGNRQRQLRSMRWGFIPHWYKKPGDGPLLINARAESVASKPAFRDAVRQRRCLIPASWFYEWQAQPDGGKKLPWRITGAGDGPMVFAGLWQRWGQAGGDAADRIETCAIVTCAANERLQPIHHRMPVILAPGDFSLWLGEAGHGAAALMRPAADNTVVAEPADDELQAALLRRPG